MNEEQIADIRARLESGATYPYEWTKRVTIKQMAEYLKTVHPELEVQLDSTSCHKDTKMGRLRSSGIREYTGYKLRVWRNLDERKENYRYGTLIDHDTTDTYRRNYEVAKKIIAYEREKIKKEESGRMKLYDRFINKDDAEDCLVFRLEQGIAAELREVDHVLRYEVWVE